MQDHRTQTSDVYYVRGIFFVQKPNRSCYVYYQEKKEPLFFYHNFSFFVFLLYPKKKRVEKN